MGTFHFLCNGNSLLNIEIPLTLISRIEFSNCISTILVESKGYIIFSSSLSVQFSYALAHNAWILETFIFELENFSHSLKMSLSIAKQSISREKMIASYANFTVLIS